MKRWKKTYKLRATENRKDLYGGKITLKIKQLKKIAEPPGRKSGLKRISGVYDVEEVEKNWPAWEKRRPVSKRTGKAPGGLRRRKRKARLRLCKKNASRAGFSRVEGEV